MGKKYTPTIGLEVHAELKTKTKMFCDSKNDTEEKSQNKNICPVCVGHPGTLPVINAEAVKHILKIGVALGGAIADFSEFDRKNYFYPDIPKGYQISQYKYPLVSGGELNSVSLTRIHLEEDTAKSDHQNDNSSLLDFNRAGIPLMELVTEPVIKTSEEAVSFAKEIQLLLRYLGISEANMEKGEMRVEANVSVSSTETLDLNQSEELVGRTGQSPVLGTKVEIKNLNSFRTVGKAIEFEVKRQSKVLDGGGRVVQETRGWDEDKEETFSQRIKEESHDYRYFPDPDLPKLQLSQVEEFSEKLLKEQLPELPWQKRERYAIIGLKSEDVEFFVRDYAFNKNLLNGLFSRIVDSSSDKEILLLSANYIVSDIAGLLQQNDRLNIEWKEFLKLMQMTKEGIVSSRGTKEILTIMLSSGGDPEEIAKENNLFQKSSEEELEGIIVRVIENNQKAWEEFRNGRESILQFLIGQGMKESKGSANPEVLKKMFTAKLS